MALNWWERGEWQDEVGDVQAPADLSAPSGLDLSSAQADTAAMEATPLGEPKINFDVRCVYDSRPVNGYDFNFSASVGLVPAGTGFTWAATFNVPNGYRIVPREWEIIFDQTPPAGIINASLSASTATILQNQAGLPNNQNIIVGMGTADPIKTFFICEENTTFGIQGFTPFAPAGNPGFANINVYGNLIAVTEVALPFAVANEQAAYRT
jgi:hypothetical protein